MSDLGTYAVRDAALNHQEKIFFSFKIAHQHPLFMKKVCFETIEQSNIRTPLPNNLYLNR